MFCQSVASICYFHLLMTGLVKLGRTKTPRVREPACLASSSESLAEIIRNPITF